MFPHGAHMPLVSLSVKRAPQLLNIYTAMLCLKGPERQNAALFNLKELSSNTCAKNLVISVNYTLELSDAIKWN